MADTTYALIIKKNEQKYSPLMNAMIFFSSEFSGRFVF